MEPIRISELEEQQNDSIDSTLVEIETQNKTKKTLLSNFIDWVGNIRLFPTQLHTSSKNIVGAINELSQRTSSDPPGAGFHNSIFRGKWLGAYPTNEQLESINNGSFNDLFIGDYWYDSSIANGLIWRIAACDYYYGLGPEAVTTHHLIIVPDYNVSRSAYYNNRGQDGYKFCLYRGYYYGEFSITTTEENQTIIDNHYSGYYLHSVNSVYIYDPTVRGGKIYWDLAEQPDSSVESCAIKIKGGYNYHPSNPNSTFSNYGIPVNTTIYWDGRYTTNYPDLSPYTMPGFINYTYGTLLKGGTQGKIMKFPLLCTHKKTNEEVMITEWTNGYAELMTEQQVNGARTIGVDHNFESDIIFNGSKFQYNRKRFETTIDSIQFPLFKLAPQYRGGKTDNISAYWFWLRDHTYAIDQGIQNYTCGQWGETIHSRYGIRPYFCLANTEESY